MIIFGLILRLLREISNNFKSNIPYFDGINHIEWYNKEACIKVFIDVSYTQYLFLLDTDALDNFLSQNPQKKIEPLVMVRCAESKNPGVNPWDQMVLYKYQFSILFIKNMINGFDYTLLEEQYLKYRIPFYIPGFEDNTTDIDFLDNVLLNFSKRSCGFVMRQILNYLFNKKDNTNNILTIIKILKISEEFNTKFNEFGVKWRDKHGSTFPMIVESLGI